MEKKYRRNVAAVVLKDNYPEKCEILLAKRIGNSSNSAWQFPQGGIDGEEKDEEALLRELKEEIGTNNIEILAKHPEWISYDFPEGMKFKDSSKMKGFVGQSQKYFLVKLKKEAKINIHTQEAEFSEYKFVNAQEVVGESAFIKRRIYAKVIGYFKKQGYIS